MPANCRLLNLSTDKNQPQQLLTGRIRWKFQPQIEKLFGIAPAFFYVVKRLFSFIILFPLFSIQGFARTPKMVPLMPPPERGGIWNELRAQSRETSKATKESLIPSLELGALATPNSNFNDLMGMQVLVGGRVAVNLPAVFDGFYLKPSVGYFRGSHSGFYETSEQHIYEGGLALHYEWFGTQLLQSFLGIANRLDYIVDVFKSQNKNSTANSLRYRVGPSAGVHIQLGSGVKLTTNLECTFAFTNPINTFGVLSTGLAFEL